MEKKKPTPKSGPPSYQGNYTTLENRKVSFYQSFKQTQNPHIISLGQVAELVKSSKYKLQIEQLRTLPTQEYREAKSKLPVIAFSGVFTNKRGKKQPLDSSKLVILDIDKLETSQIAELERKIRLDTYTVLYFTSPSGKGLKVVFHAEVNTDKDFKAAFKSIASYFREKYKIDLDQSGKDISRLCFVSYDPNAYFNPDADEYKYEQCQPIANVHANSYIQDVSDSYVNKVFKENVSLMQSAINGEIDTTLNKTAFRLGQFAHTGKIIETISKQELTSIAMTKGHTQECASKTFNQGWKAGINKPDTNYNRNDSSQTTATATATMATRLQEITSGLIQPEPIIQEVEQRAFPLKELPTTIRKAVEEGFKYIQAPLPLVAASALSMVSVACQGKIDIKRDNHLKGPSSLWFLTIAMSGDRKSTVDSHFSKALRKFEKENRAKNKEIEKEYKRLLGIWEAKKSGLHTKIKEQSRMRLPTGEFEEALKTLDEKRPKEPILPRYIYQDITQEQLRIGLKRWPSGINLSSEAGEVLNSHSMKKDNASATLSFDNKLWSGEMASQDRVSREGIILEKARLSKCWAIQLEAFEEFMAQSGKLARGIGSLARFLISKPKSLQGSRLYVGRPEYMPYNDAFQDRITNILATSIKFDSEGDLKPELMTLASEAFESWKKTYNTFEKTLKEGGELTEIRDVVSKSADNVVRMAALFEYFENNRLEVTVENLERAANIVGWYMEEALSFYRSSSMQKEDKRMLELEKWIINDCKKEDVKYISLRKIQQYAPRPRYKKDELLETLIELQSFNRGAVLEKKGTSSYYINPHLLKSCSHVAVASEVIVNKDIPTEGTENDEVEIEI